MDRIVNTGSLGELLLYAGVYLILTATQGEGSINLHECQFSAMVPVRPRTEQ